MNLKKTQKIIKDLILFDSVWNKRNKVKDLSKVTIEEIKTYRELVRNSFCDVSINIYPFTYKLLKKDWSKLLSDYLEKYPPASPVLNKVVEQLPEYLSHRKDTLKKYPFISEVSRYEWLEVEIYEKGNVEGEKEGKGEKKKSLSLNPIHEVCTFQYAIPEIVETIEDEKPLGKIYKQKTIVLVYRDPKDFSVRFFELSTSTLAFVELLKSGFSIDMVIYFLANAYKIDEKNYKSFEKEAMKLVNVLKKSRILV